MVEDQVLSHMQKLNSQFKMHKIKRLDGKLGSSTVSGSLFPKGKRDLLMGWGENLQLKINFHNYFVLFRLSNLKRPS
jgi:hypothetical protein